MFRSALAGIAAIALACADLGAQEARTGAPDSLPYKPPAMKMQSPPRLPPAAPRIIFSGDRRVKKIALTFDACSTGSPSRYDERITKVLVDAGTPATIFLGGKWMEDEPEQTRYLASNPLFELGNHSFLHPHMTRIPDARVREELLWTQAVMFTLTGRQPSLFRPPYGEYDDRLLNLAADMGLTTIEYDLASGDPDLHATGDRLVEWVTSKARPGSIVVMHINRRGWHTAEALPEIIARLRKRGFEFVKVSELIAVPHPE